jgi:hypothetical protein
MKLRVKLVEDWKKFHAWSSVRMAALLAAAIEIYTNFQSLQDYMSPTTFHHIAASLTLVIIVLRVVGFAFGSDPAPKDQTPVGSA